VERELTHEFGWRFFSDFDVDRIVAAMEAPAAPDPYYPADFSAAPPPAAAADYPPAPVGAPRPDYDAARPRLRSGGRDVSAASIVARHELRFQALEMVALQRLDALHESARQEYVYRSGSGTLNRFSMTSRYMQAGRLLERNVDEAFYRLLADLKRDLAQHGHPTDVAATIEADYRNRKEYRRSSFLRLVRDGSY
jgi:hypothetical protein